MGNKLYNFDLNKLKNIQKKLKEQVYSTENYNYEEYGRFILESSEGVAGKHKRRDGMRKIKFRGYNEYLGEWVYGGAYLDGHILTGIVESNDEYIIIKEWRPVAEGSVGQDTGLTDELGRDIYEGDYVIAYDNYTEREFIGEIVYNNGSFAIQNETSMNYRLLDYKMEIVSESSLDFYYRMNQDYEWEGYFEKS